jgi:TPR repeat protein
LAAFLVVLLPTLTANAGVDDGKKAFMAANYAQAWKELNPLAKAGNAEAQYLLGVMYSHGRGIKGNEAESARWYEAAARQGHPEAAFNLGFMLYQQEKFAEAAPWLKLAADQGNGMAASLVGTLHRHGLGVPKDEAIAHAWTLKAADKGIAGAQYEVGLTCAKLIAERRCAPAEAYKWFKLLADSGYPGASQNLAKLSAGMAAAEITEGDRLAKAWRPQG